MKKSFHIVSLTLLLLCSAGAGLVARADVKIKTKSTSGGQASEQVTYIKGKRQRAENNEASVMITQCDLRRTLQLGVPTKTYVATPFDQKTDAATPASAKEMSADANAPRRGGVVTSTYTSTDTGERKKMFGYVARRIKTSIVTESSPDACQVTRSKMETDGWYIDAQFALDCQNVAAAAYAQATQAGGCRDEYRTKQTGAAKLGYPVMVTTTLFDENGNESFTFSQEVLEITNAVLDSALFDVPADYRQVSNQMELYGAANTMSAANDSSGANSGATNNAALTGGNGAANTNSAVGPKREGVVRVGVALTKTLAAGDGVDPAALAEAARKRLVSSLSGSSIEVVTLEARQPQQVETEAKQKQCDFVLYSTVAHKKGGGGGGGGFGSFLKKSVSITGGATAVPADEGSANGNAGGVSLKAKDELTLEYRLQRGAELVVTNTLKAKAKSNGDDVISQLANQAAASVLAAATVK